MGKIKLSKLFLLLFWFLLWAFDLAVAEELLIKKDLKYLGWVTGTDEFKTCDETIMKVGDGRIEKTNDRCSTDGRPKLIVRLTGEVTMVDQPNMVFAIKDLRGHLYKLFFHQGEKELKGLRIGDEVIVTVPIPGRASAIEVRDKDKKVPKDLIHRELKKE
jgi:hypothetical protein